MRTQVVAAALALLGCGDKGHETAGAGPPTETSSRPTTAASIAPSAASPYASMAPTAAASAAAMAKVHATKKEDRSGGTLRQVLKDYNDNPIAADAKYKGKLFGVGAVVRRVRPLGGVVRLTLTDFTKTEKDPRKDPFGAIKELDEKFAHLEDVDTLDAELDMKDGATDRMLLDVKPGTTLFLVCDACDGLDGQTLKAHGCTIQENHGLESAAR